ncbi:MAG TPA: aminotransferase class I/II-fold pyridoxal phosphate-dependent enzyme [Planctomycetota bacterium]|nr:aminotransferase class I/II-fold pyridoxal phosphate-dependent enzyme [Planctomycetota bacterium]
MTRFARRMDKIEISGIRRIFDLIQGMPDAADFSLGQPDFPPPEPVQRAAVEAIRDGRNKYTVTQGMPALVERIHAELGRSAGVRDAGVIVTAGSAGALFLALGVLLEEGEEVIIPDPYFVLYKHLVNFFGGKAVFLDTYPDFRIKPDKLEALVTPKTRAILFNNPVNPTGIAYTREEVAAIAALARRRGVLLISDEIYEAFSYDFAHECALKHDPGAILIGGFSKKYGVTGWRLGYAAGPREIVDKMAMLQQFTFVCAPSTAQSAAIAALDVDMKPVIEAYRRKRDLVVQGLRDRFEIVAPQGAFYVYPKCPWGTDDEFVRRAIESKCLVVPGSACSERKTHFRISYAQSDEVLKRGIDALNKIARK